MPYATNPTDGVRSYVEDWGGDGSPILVYTGLAEPIAAAQQNGLVSALGSEHRLVFADHRGHGRSDKPHDAAAYALPVRVADACAVLDRVGLARAHVLGFSWGARLGFAIGEYASDRVLSLVLCGNQPYAWNPRWPFVPALSEVFARARDRGMQAFVDVLESSFGSRVEEPMRSWALDNDPVALAAAWRSATAEGAVSADLTAWRLPCLIYLAAGEDMYADAARAAAEIPTARLLTLHGHTHLSAPDEVDHVLPAVRETLALGDRQAAAG